MLNEKAGIFLIYLILGCISSPVYASNRPEIRDMGFDPISIQDNSQQSKSPEVRDYVRESRKSTVIEDKGYVESSATLKGNVTELNAIVGKSQMIRFDEAVKRISITNPALADLVMLSPGEMLINGKAPGVTSLIIWGESGNDPIFFDLSVKNDPSLFLNAVKAIIPNEKVDLKFTNDTNVILSGTVSSTIKRDKIKSLAETYGFKLVDLSETSLSQVLIEVKIAEASRNFTKILNTNFANGTQMIDTMKSSAKYITSSIVPETINKSGSGALFSSSLNGYIYLPNQQFSAVLSAAESKGFMKVLAEPKLMSSSGNKASFNAGQQVPVPSSIGEGGNVAYDLKDVGINVDFTPTILENTGKILLNINSEVSEIDSTLSKDTTYGFKTRKANTTVELKDGQTLVIAGLIKKKDDQSSSQMPWIGDIPIIGKFFRNSQTLKEDTELIIIVTPHIIAQDKPVEGV